MKITYVIFIYLKSNVPDSYTFFADPDSPIWIQNLNSKVAATKVSFILAANMKIMLFLPCFWSVAGDTDPDPTWIVDNLASWHVTVYVGNMYGLCRLIV